MIKYTVIRYCNICEREKVGLIAPIDGAPYFVCVHGHKSLIIEEETDDIRTTEDTEL